MWRCLTIMYSRFLCLFLSLSFFHPFFCLCFILDSIHLSAHFSHFRIGFPLLSKPITMQNSCCCCCCCHAESVAITHSSDFSGTADSAVIVYILGLLCVTWKESWVRAATEIHTLTPRVFSYSQAQVISFHCITQQRKRLKFRFNDDCLW